MYKNQTEVNDKVRVLNCKTETLETLAILHVRFENISQRLGMIDLKFDKEFLEMQDALERTKKAWRFGEIAAQMVHDRRMDYRRLSEEIEAAEHDSNKELVCVRDLVGATAVATRSFSCGTNDRENKEVTRSAIGMLGKDSHDDHKICHARGVALATMMEAKSTKKAEAVKSRGREKAGEEEEMSMTKAPEEKDKDQVNLKRNEQSLWRRLFFPISSFQLLLNSRGWQGHRAEGRGLKAEGRGCVSVGMSWFVALIVVTLVGTPTDSAPSYPVPHIFEDMVEMEGLD